LIIRKTETDDLSDILSIHKEAFVGDKGIEVAELTGALLADNTAEPRVSLLAVVDEVAVGHILFTKSQLPDSNVRITSSILSPLAVIPKYQSQGIGGQLIKNGIVILSQNNIQLVFVLGHPNYYPLFGFSRACPHGFTAPFQSPGTSNDAWMVQELFPGSIETCSGQVKCADALHEPVHWGK